MVDAIHPKIRRLQLIGAEAKLWFDYKANEPKISVSAESIEPIPQSKIKMAKGEI